jgi:hypothetical protein
MEAIFAAISYRSEPIVTTIEEPKSIRGGVELAIFFVFCICHKICGSTCYNC